MFIEARKALCVSPRHNLITLAENIVKKDVTVKDLCRIMNKDCMIKVLYVGCAYDPLIKAGVDLDFLPPGRKGGT